MHVGEHWLIVALWIAADGQQHALGLWNGSKENATLCQVLLANLQSRGLRTDRSLLVILDGAKTLRKAVRDLFGDGALVQCCQVHKTQNVLDQTAPRHHARTPAHTGGPTPLVHDMEVIWRSSRGARSFRPRRTLVTLRFPSCQLVDAARVSGVTRLSATS